MSKYAKYFIFLIICLFPFSVRADCNDSDISKLKKLADNVNIEHKYSSELIDEGNLTMPKTTNEGSFYIYSPEDSEKYKSTKGSLTAIISGISEDLMIEDANSGYIYTFADVENNGIIINNVSFENREYNVYSNECGVLLRTINFDDFNSHYDDDFCKKEENQELSMCQMFTNSDISDDSFKQTTDKYEKEKNNNVRNNNIIDVIKQFLINYYLYIIIGIVLIVILVILINRRRKRSVLE